MLPFLSFLAMGPGTGTSAPVRKIPVPKTQAQPNLLSPEIEETLRLLGWATDAQPHTPDPYALGALSVPTPWGSVTVPGPSKAQQAGMLEQQAALLAPDPFGAARAEADAEIARNSAMQRALLDIEPPTGQHTALDLSSFPRPTLTPAPLPERPSAAPTPLMLGASALAGLLGGWPQALASTVGAAKAQADTRYQDMLQAWEQDQRQRTLEYQEAQAARTEALMMERDRLAAEDAVANARAQARHALGLRRLELGADAEGTEAKVRTLGGLSSSARDYGVAAATAKAARAEVERDDEVRQSEARDMRAGQQQARMLIGSLLQSQAADRRADISQQNADTSRMNAENRAAYQRGMLAARRQAASIRSSTKSAPKGSRTDEVARAERLRYEALQKAAVSAERIWLEARAKQDTFGGPKATDVAALAGVATQLRSEALKQFEIYQSSAKSGSSSSGRRVFTGTYKGTPVEIIEE